MSHPSIVRTGNLSPNADSFQTILHLHQRALFAAIIKKLLLIFLPAVLFFSTSLSQVVLPPSDIDCPSNDLEVTSAILPAPANDPCACTGTRTLQLGIKNKTGSDRTSFAMWGKLIRKDASGNPVGSPEAIFACATGIKASSTNFYPTTTSITIACAQSLEIVDVILAWTSANKKETCEVLYNNPSTINPKCGRVDAIRVETGVDASFNVTNATCTSNGSIQVFPFGGIAPYKVKIGNDERTGIPAGGSTTFTLPAGEHDILITDSRPCSSTRSRTVESSLAPPVSAGTAFTKTCTSNTTGVAIGEANDGTATYSWSPSTGLSSAIVSNPTANPDVTTTYTVTKTSTANGCTAQASVVVTVNTTAPPVSAGTAFTKTCTSNISGAAIGEANDAAATYSWSPSTGLSSATVSNPTANPTTTTNYTVTKTTANGCTAQASVLVTVNTTLPPVSAGTAFTKTCTSNATGAAIGEANDAAATYSWSPSTGLSSATVSNPTANPTTTTTYTVTKTNIANGCSNTDQVTVTVNTTAPDAPTVCIVQPSLCGPATGSVTVTSPLGDGFEYSILNGINGSWQASNVFNNVAAGTITGIKVKSPGGCISLAADCSASNCTASRSQTTSSTQNKSGTPINTLTELKVSEPTVKAFPNPFGNKVKFVVTIPEAGNGNLELVNLLGQKVKTVFQGRMPAGANTFEVNLPLMRSSQLIYMLRMGDKQITGKLLQLNQ